MSKPPVVWTIAGFDPSCGAGIGADLKTIKRVYLGFDAQHRPIGFAIPAAAAALPAALEEAREAIDRVANGQAAEVELSPQPALVRRLQHELAERANLSSASSGHEPYRRVQIFR